MAPETASVPGLEPSPSSPVPDPSPSSSTLSTTTSHPSASRLSVSLSAHSRRLFTLRAVHTFYHHWAHFIVRNTWACLVFCTLLTIACTVKIALTPQQNDITNYTPYGARSRHELTIQQQFFNAQGLGNHLGAFVLLMPLHRDDPTRDNFLHPAMLAEAARVDDIVRKQFPLLNHRINRTQTFEDFCTDFCDINEPMRRFEEGFRIQSELLASNQSLNPAIQLNYPTSSILGRKFNIQPNFFGITFRSKNSTNNDSTTISNMERVEMLVLTYKAERVGGWSDAEVEGWEMAISDFFANEFHSDLVRTMTTSVTHVNAEVVRAGLSMLPFLVIGFVIMALCSSVCVFLSASYWRQWHPRKLHLALAACICPFMACGTALGLLFLFGVRFGSILCVTPFLVLAIGVDDAYLMIHAWQRVTERERKKRILEAGSAKAEKEKLESAEEDPVAHRLELVLVDTGPAILISALTNICADAVGAFTGSPEITLLCVGNMTAMAVDFLYQVTFYAAIMALVGRAELRDEMRKQSEKKTKANAKNQKQLDKMEKGPSRSISRKVHTFIDHYVRLISHPIMASLITLVWITFLVFSAIGISRFEVNLSTKKLFAADSPLLEIDHYREQQIVPFFQMATVFINSPTNMSDPHRMARIRALVEGMEHLPESWGPQSTNDVLRELEQYIGEEDGGDMEGWLEQFLDWPESRYWRGFIRHPAPEANWNGSGNGTKADMLDSFYFTTGYHGQKLKLWSERTQLLKKWRAVVDRFADDLNASVFHDESIFLDLIDNMPTDAWQSAVTTLCAMCAICALFLGTDLRSVVLAGTIIASIIAGTLGILSWLGTTMDPIMMAALIISIGFSVDIPAHVSYHFHTSAFELHSSASASSALPPSVPDRLRATLASVGLPALQASLSTSLCVLSLLFVPLYMARVFVLIMCSTIALCILHSLVLLPALLSLTDRVRCGRTCGGHRSEKDQSANQGIKQFRN